MPPKPQNRQHTKQMEQIVAEMEEQLSLSEASEARDKESIATLERKLASASNDHVSLDDVVWSKV
eukprot:m.152951 g.152951  ORF g.152951 m.152951 type:complete len:65 (+) comp15114_c0_seq3:5564-5758(+)